MRSILFALVMAAAASALQAASEKFESSSLKYLYQITLDVRKDKVKGVFERSEYGVNRVKYGFRGVVVPTPGQKGTTLKVSFSTKDLARKGAPYNFPAGGESQTWRLVETKEGPSLLVPFSSRTGKSSSWKTQQVEFEPISRDR